MTTLAAAFRELTSDRKVLFAVLVSALGYFVDIYDMMLFSVLRVPSLQNLGVSGESLLNEGVFLLNVQLVGMLIGGFLWGILGDKIGRVRALFGSIALYSLATIANAFVGDVPTYAICRFFAGLGLAGELGACVTLVSELMSRNGRGLGIMILTCSGMLGGLAASLVGTLFFWKTAFLVGGGMGLALLVLRLSVAESMMFTVLKKAEHVSRGSLLLLFRSKDRLKRYFLCVFMSWPVWFVTGVFDTFSPEIARDIGIVGTVTVGTTMIVHYVAISLGDVFFGAMSLTFKNRRKVMATGVFCTLLGIGTLLTLGKGQGTTFYYGLVALCGFGVGYSAVYATTLAEQFGTNLRATATVSITNFMRGIAIPALLAFRYLKESTGSAYAAGIVGAVILVLALFALWRTRETYGVDLDFVEREDR